MRALHPHRQHSEIKAKPLPQTVDLTAKRERRYQHGDMDIRDKLAVRILLALAKFLARDLELRKDLDSIDLNAWLAKEVA